MKLASLITVFYRKDQEIAREAQLRGCPICKGKLDVANYPRKPRGVSFSEGEEVRFSFCCRECRKRMTPASLRFLGAKVYFFLVVIQAVIEYWQLASRQYASLFEKYGVSAQTINRWIIFWQKKVPQSKFYKQARGNFREPVPIISFPGSLLKVFEETAGRKEAGIAKMVEFLSPLSTLGFQVI